MVEVDTPSENTDTKTVEESATVQGKPEQENGKQEIMITVQPDVSASEFANKASADAAESELIPVTPVSTTSGGEDKTVDDKAGNMVSPAGGNSRKRKRKKVNKPRNTIPVSENEQKPQDKKEEGQDDKGKSPATGKNSRRRMKKKAANDKPDASTKEDTKKESMGMIFMCSSKTKKDCYRYKVLGLPAAKKDMVAKIYKGMRLFLFDFDLKLLYGIYKAAEPGGYNIEPKAFNSAFPSQVRFTGIEDCLPLPEEKFKAVIKDNYYAKNKFDCQLKAEQVKNLCKLFKATTTKGREPKHVRKPEARSFADRNRERGQGRDRERRPGQERDRRQGRDRELQRGRILDRRHVEDRVRRTRPEADAMYDNQPVILAPHLAYAYERPMDIDYHRRDLELSYREENMYFDPHGGLMEPPAVHDRYLPPFQEHLYTRAHEAPRVYSRHPPPPAHETPVSYHESVYGRDVAPPVYILPHTAYRY